VSDVVAQDPGLNVPRTSARTTSSCHSVDTADRRLTLGLCVRRCHLETGDSQSSVLLQRAAAQPTNGSRDGLSYQDTCHVGRSHSTQTLTLARLRQHRRPDLGAVRPSHPHPAAVTECLGHRDGTSVDTDQCSSLTCTDASVTAVPGVMRVGAPAARTDGSVLVAIGSPRVDAGVDAERRRIRWPRTRRTPERGQLSR
jgi:hypothetical protein